MRLLSALMDDILNQHPRPYYVFTGSEDAIMDIYLKEMSLKWDMPLRKADDLHSALSLSKGSLLSKNGRITVYHANKPLQGEEDQLANVKLPNILVAIYDNIDSRTKFATKLSDDTYDFNTVPEPIFAKHIGMVLPLNDANMKDFYSLVNGALGYSLLEADKVTQYSKAIGCDNDQAYRILREQGFIGNTDPTNLIGAIDASFQGRYDLMLEMLKNEEPVSSLYLFFNSYYNTWLVKSYGNRQDIMEKTGLNIGIIKACKWRRTIYSLAQLKEMALLMVDIEQALKMGKLPANSVFPMMASRMAQV